MSAVNFPECECVCVSVVSVVLSLLLCIISGNLKGVEVPSLVVARQAQQGIQRYSHISTGHAQRTL